MNPSTSGWIEKLFYQFSNQEVAYDNFDSLYSDLRSFGFIYGVNVSITNTLETTLNYSEDELAKINLLTGFYHIKSFYKPGFTVSEFIFELLSFYKSLEVSDLSLWDKLVIGKSESGLLERLIHDRVNIDDNIITRNFNKSITNSLLFVDLLAFQNYLIHKTDPKTYSANLERIIIGTLYQSLNSKGKVTAYDKQIMEIIEASSSISSEGFEVEDIIFDIDYNIDQREKKYLIDLMCLSIWDDEILEKTEYQFLLQLANELNIDADVIKESILSVSEFHSKNKKAMLLFQHSHPIANFYENSTQLVIKLIRRNSKRLVKELQQSKELMLLISKSTHSDLSKEEQKRLQSQLIDVLKTVPSLAIFMLPGGAILLPIFAKLIPNILPSAFDDNRIEK